MSNFPVCLDCSPPKCYFSGKPKFMKILLKIQNFCAVLLGNFLSKMQIWQLLSEKLYSQSWEFRVNFSKLFCVIEDEKSVACRTRSKGADFWKLVKAVHFESSISKPANVALFWDFGEIFGTVSLKSFPNLAKISSLY